MWFLEKQAPEKRMLANVHGVRWIIVGGSAAAAWTERLGHVPAYL